MLEREEVSEDNFYSHFDIIFDETQNKYDIKSSYMLKADYSAVEHEYQVLNENEEIVKVVDLFNRQGELNDEEQAELDTYLDRFENEIDTGNLHHLQQVAEVIMGVNHDDLNYVQEQNNELADAYEYMYDDMP